MDAIYAMHARWLTEILGPGDSLFTPGTAIWTNLGTCCASVRDTPMGPVRWPSIGRREPRASPWRPLRSMLQTGHEPEGELGKAVGSLMKLSVSNG